MILSDILIKNIGPISNFDATFSINGDNKKPILIVGPNGSGKTILISHIVDALFEFACQAFGDVVRDQGQTQRAYFKVVGGTNVRLGSDYGLCIIKFVEGEKNLFYVDKSGHLETVDILNKYPGRFDGLKNWSTEENVKYTSSEKSIVERVFIESTICYFPTSRYEIPHWLNTNSVNFESDSYIGKVSGFLGKPIFSNTTYDDNLKWIIHALSDSLLDYQILSETEVNIEDRLVKRRILLKRSVRNVEIILQYILDYDTQIFLRKKLRTNNVCVESNNSLILPTLRNLSSGQAALFNLFCTIIRYSDKNNPNTSINLSDISGIVIIDEIEKNLHTKLQSVVLPKLIKMFPKIQFFITSHSPIFLLGMQEEFGSEEIEIIEMPKGVKIPADSFSEYKAAYEVYRTSELFKEKIMKLLGDQEKTLVFTEGETDARYLSTAISLLKNKELCEKVEIQPIGAIENSKSKYMGSKNLDNAMHLFICHPNLLKNQVVLLYDSDENKSNKDEKKLFIRGIKKNSKNTKIKKGIENLFPEALFEIDRKRFYGQREFVGDYGEIKKIEEFNKTEFCKFICDERKNPSDFQEFIVILRMLLEIINGN